MGHTQNEHYPSKPGWMPATKHDLEEFLERIEKYMIPQATFDAAVASLTTAVNNAVAAMAAGSTATSTPDTVVNAFLADVSTQTVNLASGTPPAAAPPTPPAP